MKTGKGFFVGFMSFIALSIAIMQAQAAPVTFIFTGEVYAVNPPWDSFFTIGDSVQGSYTFESATPDIDADTGIGHYANALTNMTISVGGTTFRYQPGYQFIYVLNNESVKINDSWLPATDLYQVFSDLQPALGFSHVRTNLYFRDDSQNIFSSDALPLVFPDVSQFNYTHLQVFGYEPGVDDPNGAGVHFRITAAGSAVPVPHLTGISPRGVMAGGPAFDLEVSGRDFVRTSRVLWDGEVLRDAAGREIAPTFLSSRQLRVQVPAGYIASSMLVTVRVESPGPGGGQSAGTRLTVRSPGPAVTGLTLKSVPSGNAEYEVGIYGARFAKESVAEWNGSARETVYVNSGRLLVRLQAEDLAVAGSGTVTVLNPGPARSNGAVLDVVTLAPGSPEIRRLIPDVINAATGGFTLVVEGSGFVAGSRVLWNGVEKTTRYESAERLSADIPESDLGGAETYLVTVRNPAAEASMWLSRAEGGEGSSNTAIVSNMNKVPLLTGFSPAAVAAGSGGFELRIRGAGYAVGKTMVTWNEKGLESRHVSEGELAVDVPASYVASAGVVTVGVENPAPGGGSQTKAFTILANTSARGALMYPRLVNEGNGAESTGVVWANLSENPAKLTAWAYGKEGELIEGEKLTNPVALTASAEEQQAIMDWQFFGETFRDGKEGWLKLESTETRVAGFFMMFDDAVTYTDGANAIWEPVEEFVFPEIEDKEGGFTKIYISNPDGGKATLTFELRDGSGRQKGTPARREIPGHGTLVEPVGELFGGIQAGGGDYIRVVSDRGVVPFEYMGEKPKYVHALNGQGAARGGTVLHGPQYAVGGGQYQTTMSVVNLDSAGGTVTFRLISPEGMPLGEVKSLPIEARGKLKITDQNFFVEAGDRLTTGYVEIRSSGPRLTGSITFGDPERETMASSLPLVSELLESMLFAHVVSNKTWWTGIALLNPWAEAADVTLTLYERAGKPIGEKRVTVGAGRQQIGLLREYFDWMKDKEQQGYVRVTSNKRLAGFALFGTTQLSVISAIPAQTVPTE